MSIQIQGSQNIAGMSVQSMDIETVLLTVQNQRATLLEGQLRGQMETVAAKNQSIGKANEQLGTKRSELATLEASNATGQASLSELKLMKEQLQQVVNRDPNGWTGLSYGWGGDDAAKSQEMLKRVQAQALTGANQATDIDRNGTMDAKGRVVQGFVDQLDAKISALQAQIADNGKTIDANKQAVTEIKSSLDNLSNTQQMEMLRLQGLTGKRNEAFDVMTNFLKKMQESRSSIIGNMR